MRHITVGRFFTILGLLLVAILVSSCQGVALLDPQGPIGAQERDLILMAIGLSLLVILPVFGMVAYFSLRYRESNKKATYKPHWEGSGKFEAAFWLIPVIIIGVLSYLTWTKTIDLDPYKSIPSAQQPLKVQVVSLDWNWLFIYPELGVASLNEVVLPATVPVSFEITSATVMTSFFIPDLGSQMYAMGGMVTRLNLLADKPGQYTGYNILFSGKGYNKMYFDTKAVSKSDFDAWVAQTKTGAAGLTQDLFKKLNTPQEDLPVTTYASVEPDLFSHIVGSIMSPRGSKESGTNDMNMSEKKE